MQNSDQIAPLTPEEQELLVADAVDLMAQRIWEPAELFDEFVKLTRRTLDHHSEESSAKLENVQL